MNRRLFSGSKVNRDLRDAAFAQEVIAIAERNRREEERLREMHKHHYHSPHHISFCCALCVDASHGQLAPGLFAGGFCTCERARSIAQLLDNRDPMDSGLCCMARHANTVAPWTCDCPCHNKVEEEEPLGECPFCGTEYFTESERGYHSDAECIGGTERFR